MILFVLPAIHNPSPPIFSDRPPDSLLIWRPITPLRIQNASIAILAAGYLDGFKQNYWELEMPSNFIQKQQSNRQC
jgi:hypothetical protein